MDRKFLGIELGSTRIKAVVIDGTGDVLASGSFAWENRQADGGAHVYFLAMDWYREPGFLRRATLRVGADHYNVDVPFGVMLKCVCNGKSAVWAKSEEGEVLSLGENAAAVQGAGIVTFCVAKNGTVTEKTVDFTVAPVAEITLD